MATPNIYWYMATEQEDPEAVEQAAKPTPLENFMSIGMQPERFWTPVKVSPLSVDFQNFPVVCLPSLEMPPNHTSVEEENDTAIKP